MIKKFCILFMLAAILVSCGSNEPNTQNIDYYVTDSSDLIFLLPQEDFGAAQDQYILSSVQVTGRVFYIDIPSTGERGTTYAMQVAPDNKVVFVYHTGSGWGVSKSKLSKIWGEIITVRGTVVRMDLQPGYAWGHISIKDAEIIDG